MGKIGTTAFTTAQEADKLESLLSAAGLAAEQIDLVWSKYVSSGYKAAEKEAGMLIPAETLQKLIDIEVEKQRHADQVARYRAAGDTEAAAFLDRPKAQQQYLLAQQDLRDAADATNAGDRAGVVNAITRAISRGPDAIRPRRRLRG